MAFVFNLCLLGEFSRFHLFVFIFVQTNCMAFLSFCRICFVKFHQRMFYSVLEGQLKRSVLFPLCPSGDSMHIVRQHSLFCRLWRGEILFISNVQHLHEGNSSKYFCWITNILCRMCNAETVWNWWHNGRIHIS